MSERSTLTPKIEEQMVKAIRQDPQRHITMPAGSYRKDGSLLITRDGLNGIRAQRHLYRRLIGPLQVGEYLRKNCREKGCLNPFHYSVRDRSREQLTHCRNGHEYIPENTLLDGVWRCRICRDADRKRRRERYAQANKHTLRSPAEVNREKTHCPANHEYTEENTYTRVTATGRIHRQCRTCTIERARARAAEARRARIESALTTLRKAS